LVREKFLTTAGRAIGAERAAESARMIENMEQLSPTELARLTRGLVIAEKRSHPSIGS